LRRQLEIERERVTPILTKQLRKTLYNERQCADLFNHRLFRRMPMSFKCERHSECRAGHSFDISVNCHGELHPQTRSLVVRQALLIASLRELAQMSSWTAGGYTGQSIARTSHPTRSRRYAARSRSRASYGRLNRRHPCGSPQSKHGCAGVRRRWSFKIEGGGALSAELRRLAESECTEESWSAGACHVWRFISQSYPRRPHSMIRLAS
jgi:hypothetical protein